MMAQLFTEASCLVAEIADMASQGRWMINAAYEEKWMNRADRDFCWSGGGRNHVGGASGR